jgi:hypothetical protein
MGHLQLKLIWHFNINQSWKTYNLRQSFQNRDYQMVGPWNNGTTMVNSTLIEWGNSHDLPADEQHMDGEGPLWYILWAFVAIFGVLTWYLRNFTQRVQATKLSAMLGVISMLSLVTWTWTDF